MGELFNMERIVLGAALGIGAVAAAPFTGGGSVLGAASLAGSLSGVGTSLAAAAASFVGAAIVDGMGMEAEASAYNEGYAKARKKYITRKKKIEEKYGPLV